LRRAARGSPAGRRGACANGRRTVPRPSRRSRQVAESRKLTSSSFPGLHGRRGRPTIGPKEEGNRLSFLPSRRKLLRVAPLGLAPALIETPLEAAVPGTFPGTPPELAREMVAVSHGNVKRVRELVEAHPALAKAAWDWGFGDWETALGAASHVGNREIA